MIFKIFTTQEQMYRSVLYINVFELLYSFSFIQCQNHFIFLSLLITIKFKWILF